jgi:hypothetical protein
LKHAGVPPQKVQTLRPMATLAAVAPEPAAVAGQAEN